MTAPRTTFIDSIVDGFRGWRDFSGRATRPQYWYWTLFTVLLNMIFSTVDGFLFPSTLPAVSFNPQTFSSADYQSLLDAIVHELTLSTASWLEFILLVPTIAVTARRFRDGGWPAWLGTVVRVVPYLTTLTILSMGYSMSALVDDASTSNITSLIAGSAATLALGLLSFAALVVMLIGTLRRTAPVGE
jgi:uncharacterized membrane protein YhaH (DUF805 family)